MRTSISKLSAGAATVLALSALTTPAAAQQVGTIDGTDHPGTFDINGLAKDLSLALDQAAQKGVRMPVAETVRRLYADAAEAGLGGCDGASLSRFLADR